MKKLRNNALKTGLCRENIGSLFSVGFITFLLSFFSSCAKNAATTSKNTADNGIKPAEKPLTPADVILDSSTVLDKQSCGPTPNYPCGTRYYTVSIADFEN